MLIAGERIDQQLPVELSSGGVGIAERHGFSPQALQAKMEAIVTALPRDNIHGFLSFEEAERMDPVLTEKLHKQLDAALAMDPPMIDLLATPLLYDHESADEQLLDLARRCDHAGILKAGAAWWKDLAVNPFDAPVHLVHRSIQDRNHVAVKDLIAAGADMLDENGGRNSVLGSLDAAIAARTPRPGDKSSGGDAERGEQRARLIDLRQFISERRDVAERCLQLAARPHGIARWLDETRSGAGKGLSLGEEANPFIFASNIGKLEPSSPLFSADAWRGSEADAARLIAALPLPLRYESSRCFGESEPWSIGILASRLLGRFRFRPRGFRTWDGKALGRPCPVAPMVGARRVVRNDRAPRPIPADSPRLDTY